MNAIASFTVSSLRANKVRTLVTIGGVALAAALLVAVLTTFVSLTSFMYKSEEAIAGSWMAVARSDNAAELSDQLAKAEESDEVSASAMMRTVGFGQLTDEQRKVNGSYLPVISVSGDIETVCAIRPSEGRLPENPDEILLFETWEQYSKLSIGDTLTIPVGERRAKLAPGKSGSLSGETIDAATEMHVRNIDIKDGDLLDITMGYFDSEADEGIFDEELVNTHERTFTVVGFFDARPQTISYGVGVAGVTVEDKSAAGLAEAYVVVPDVSNTDQVKQRMEELFPSADIELHMSMLRFMGVRSDAAIWDTFFGVAAVLAAVIVAACVSLIYNAFAISVSERTAQFGLLASVGASKRQLRRSVMLEALIVAAFGVPLGILIGLGGCAVTFAILGPSIALVFGNADVPFEINIVPWVLVVAAILTLATVLFSVFIPAWRAGRVGIVDSLRGVQARRASKKGIARSEKNTDPNRLWKKRGIEGRIFGIGGLLARINQKRGVSKGAAASVSLALAVVLLMTAGSLNTFLGTLVGVVNNGPKFDVGIVACMEKNGAKLSEMADLYTEAYTTLCQTPDTDPKGWCMYDFASMIFSENMIGADLRGTRGTYEQIDSGGIMADGSYGVYSAFTFLNDADFDAYVSERGLNVADYHDLEKPQAIAMGRVYGNNGSTYQILNVLQNPGSVRLLLGGTNNGRVIEGFTQSWDAATSSFSFTPFVSQGDTIEEVPLEETQLVEATIDVSYISDEPISLVSGSGYSLQLIMPMSAAYSPVFDKFKEGTDMAPVFNSGFDAVSGDHEAVSAELTDTGNTFFKAQEGFTTDFFYMNDYAANFEDSQMMAMIVNVFCLLFTVILALIAMANVFNTITNSLILRRREFAVMRSVGMSGKQFRAMIMDECVGFGMRGLIPGLLLSTVISYLLYRMVTQSISGLAFGLPWGYVALALAMTCVAIVISAAFGMHRCNADNVVETLRADTI